MTRAQYSILRELLISIASEVQRQQGPQVDVSSLFFPSWRTIHRLYHDILLPGFSVQAKRFRLSLSDDTVEEIAVGDDFQPADPSSHSDFAVVLPSQYARADIRCIPLMEEAIITSSSSLCSHGASHECPHTPRHECIDSIPLISQRHWMSMEHARFHVDNETTGFPVVCESGDIVVLVCYSKKLLHLSLSGFYVDNSSPNTTARGTVLLIGYVRAESEKPNYADLSTGQDWLKRLHNLLCFSAYDGRNVPVKNDVLQVTTRVATKPGDIICVLAPHPNIPPTSLIVVVNRFWEDIGELNRHCFRLDLSSNDGVINVPETIRPSPIFDSDRTLIADLKTITKVNSTKSAFLPGQAANVVPSFGYLPSGELYFIYRFVLFADAFRSSTGLGTQSTTGVYLFPLNLSSDARNSPDAARIITALPSTVQTKHVLNTLVEDIVDGAVNGFIATTARNQNIRAFLDFVGCTGDTIGIQKDLDVRGIAGTAFCHLCNTRRLTYSRQKDARPLFTSPYISPLYSCRSRSLVRCQSVRASQARTHVLQCIGLQGGTNPKKPELDSDPSLELPLFVYARRLHQRRSERPRFRLANGTPLLPLYFDPYRSCLIGPDHLLKIQIQQVTSAILYVLTQEDRLVWEARMVSTLNDTKIARDKRLLDPSGNLLGTTISNLFALSILLRLFPTMSNTFTVKSTILKRVLKECVEILQETCAFLLLTWTYSHHVFGYERSLAALSTSHLPRYYSRRYTTAAPLADVTRTIGQLQQLSSRSWMASLPSLSDQTPTVS